MSDTTSNNNGTTDQIHQIQLKGHKASVLSLDHSSSKQGTSHTNTPICHLLSGDEAGTARLWDFRTGVRAALCMMVPDDGPQEVNSVAFSPPPSKSDVSTGNNPFSHDFTVYLSAGKHVYSYDLRKATAPVVKQYTHNVSTVLENAEEVNHLSFSFPGRGNSTLNLAAGDDGGCVRVSDTLTPPSHSSTSHNTRTRKRILHHDPDELAMVTSAVFRPRSTKSLDLATGGTDCTIHLWDVNRPRRPSSTHHIANDDAGANQVCNPPMVHSLSWSPSGRLLAGALGDGSCCILRVDGRRLVEVDRLRDGHDAAVASILFPGFGGSSSSSLAASNHVAARDRLVASAGNDGAIFLWDLGADSAGEGALDPSDIFVESILLSGQQQPNNNETKMKQDSLEDDMEGLTLTGGSKLLFGIRHQHKPNFLVSSGTDNVFASALFVADTTNDITAYTLPLR